ncbi:MAG: NAD kinase [Bacteroidales bacterium]|nr:NAD kinase [Bacteroidales bacterium]
MRIAIYGNSYQDQHLAELAQFLRELAGLNVWVEMEASFFNYLSRALNEPPVINDVIHGRDFSAALALSVGGDGTFLRTAGWVADKEIPILGINTGHLGYLAAVPVQHALDMVKEVINDRCRVESRSLLALEIPGRSIDTWPFALNEVAILKDDTASMISVDAHIDHHPLATYMADGLIVSTPTGSTGYNLSVGGPIIEPTATNWVISPIAAHSLTMRPLVVNNQSVIELTTQARASQSFRVSLDGRSLTLPTGTPLRLSLAPFAIRVVQPHDHYFTSTLRKKLYWGVDPR